MRSKILFIFSILLFVNWACKEKEIPNLAPIANAGQSQSLAYGSEVKLDGQASRDPENKTLAYKWAFKSKPAGSDAALTGETGVNAQFKADKPGQYVLTLTVTDVLGLSSLAEVIITIMDAKAPIANAGSAQSVLLGSKVILDASASSDPENRGLTFLWIIKTKPSSSVSTITNATISKTEFLADKVGDYVFNLAVTNDAKVTSNVELKLTVTPSGKVPIANAGKDQSITVNTKVNLDGSGSTDADNDKLSYSWTFKSKPSVSQAIFSNDKIAKTDFTADVIGTYVVTLTVSDGIWPAVSNDVTIVANAVPTVQNQFIYVAVTNFMFAFDAKTGEKLWKSESLGSYYVKGNPTYSNGVVIVACKDQIFGINSTTGKIKWKFAVSDYIETSPVVENNLVFFGSDNSYVYALDIATGAKKWEFKASGLVNKGLTIDNGTLIFGDNNKQIFGLDTKTGNKKWNVSMQEGSMNATPIVVNGIVYIILYNSKLFAIDSQTGSVKWSNKIYLANTQSSSPAYANGFLYYMFERYIVCVDLKDGSQKWQKLLGASYLDESNPAVGGGFVYCINNQDIQALNLVTGTREWIYSSNKRLEFSSPTYANGILYFSSSEINNEQNTLFIFDAKGKLLQSSIKEVGDFSAICIVDEKGNAFHSSKSGN